MKSTTIVPHPPSPLWPTSHTPPPPASRGTDLRSSWPFSFPSISPPLHRTALLSVFLCLVGLFFAVSGLSLALTGPSLMDGLPFLVLGGLTLIPGGFHLGLLSLAYTQSYGWTFDNIPNYDTQ